MMAFPKQHYQDPAQSCQNPRSPVVVCILALLLLTRNQSAFPTSTYFLPRILPAKEQSGRA